MKNDILYPPAGTLRAIFLFVGQGESTLVIVPDGDSHQYILIDSKTDKEGKGVDIKKLLDELGENKVIFINTHPHSDHINGVGEIKDNIKEVWHSGHKPSKKYGEGFEELESVIKEVGDENTFYLRGSNDLNALHTDREESSKDRKSGV